MTTGGHHESYCNIGMHAVLYKRIRGVQYYRDWPHGLQQRAAGRWLQPEHRQRLEVGAKSERRGYDHDEQRRRGQDKEWQGCIQKPKREDMREDCHKRGMQLKPSDSY